MRRMMSFLAGGMSGALVGAVAALLLAPSSGTQLRSRMQAELNTLADEARQAYEDRRIQLEERLEELKSSRKPSEEEVPVEG